MSLSSDWVSLYREKLGTLLKAREALRALHRALGTDSVILDDVSAFEGTNSDLTKTDILTAKAVLDTLDADNGLSTAEPILYKVSGPNALPK